MQRPHAHECRRRGGAAEPDLEPEDDANHGRQNPRCDGSALSHRMGECLGLDHRCADRLDIFADNLVEQCAVLHRDRGAQSVYRVAQRAPSARFELGDAAVVVEVGAAGGHPLQPGFRPLDELSRRRRTPGQDQLDARLLCGLGHRAHAIEEGILVHTAVAKHVHKGAIRQQKLGLMGVVARHVGPISLG